MMGYELKIRRGKAKFRDEFGKPLDEFGLDDDKKAGSRFINLMRKLS